MRIDHLLRYPLRPACEPLEDRRLLFAGDADISFGGSGRVVVDFPGSKFVVDDVAVQADGKVVLAGAKGVVAAVARLNADGSADPSFGNGGLFEIARMDGAFAVALQADGAIVVAGDADRHFAVARLSSGGNLDPSFGDAGIVREELGDVSRAQNLAIQTDGKIIAVGFRFAGFIGDDDFAVLRLNPDGGPDNTFDADGVVTVGFGGDEEAMAVAVDYNGTAATNPLYGSIVVAGGYPLGNSRFNVARLTPAGKLDGSFDGDGKLGTSFQGASFARATGVVIQSGGRVVATGTVGQTEMYAPGDHDFAMARYLANGDLDPSFGSDGTGRVVTDLGGNDLAFDVAVDHLGGLAVGGASFTNVALAVYTRDGRPDTRFAGDGTLLSAAGLDIQRYHSTGLAVAPGRRLVVAGGVGRVNRYFDVAPVVGLVSFDTTGSEEGQETAAFFVLLDQAAPTPLRVYLSVGGTATPPSRATRFPDYTGFAPADPLLTGSGYVDIPAGQTFATVVITPVDDALAEGDETAVFSVRNDDQYDLGDHSEVTLTIRDNEAAGPVRVAQVFVNGPGLTTGTTANAVAFRAAAGIDGTFGFAVPAGPNQLKSIPWVNGVNQVAIRFDGDVASRLQQGDLVVRGVTTPTDPFTGFSYDAATKTGVWTLAAAITNDKLRLFLDDALIGGLDGEWANASAGESYPSGNGTAGGDFSFRINLLGGDVSGDGQINALDLSFIKQRLNRTATNPGTSGATYAPFGDLTGDGLINALDLSAAKQRLNLRLPAGEPAAALLWARRPGSA